MIAADISLLESGKVSTGGSEKFLASYEGLKGKFELAKLVSDLIRVIEERKIAKSNYSDPTVLDSPSVDVNTVALAANFGVSDG